MSIHLSMCVCVCLLGNYDCYLSITSIELCYPQIILYLDLS